MPARITATEQLGQALTFTLVHEAHMQQSTRFVTFNTGNPSWKYEYRRTSAMLRNIRNIRICMGKKQYHFRVLRKGF